MLRRVVSGFLGPCGVQGLKHQHVRSQHVSTAKPTSPLFRLDRSDRGDGWTVEKVPPEHLPSSKAVSQIILRDACKCPRCVDQSTSQREFSFAEIPVDVEGQAYRLDKDNSWQVRWNNDIPGFDNHVSVFTQAQIDDLALPPKGKHQSSTMLWGQSTFRNETTKIRYADFMHDEDALAQALYLFARHGLVFITNIPRDPEATVALAERIAPVRNTFYGSVWDVKSRPQAKNVAYTSKYLGFHMDLMYMKETPCVQFLHCLDNSCSGGESRFVDGLKAIDVMATENPYHAKMLAKARIRYEYDNDGYYYSDVKPIVEAIDPMAVPRRKLRGHSSGHMAHVGRIYWGPQFVGSMLADPGERLEHTRMKLQAAKFFAETLERPNLVYEEKMEPGTCAVFNNQRVLHARNEFDLNSGQRWLRGCYLDDQDMLSKELSMSDRIARLDSEMNDTSRKIRGTS